jgi:hypothetical protein
LTKIFEQPALLGRPTRLLNNLINGGGSGDGLFGVLFGGDRYSINQQLLSVSGQPSI